MWFSKISIQENKSKALDEPPMGEKEKKKKEAIAKKKSSHCQHCGKYCLDLTLLDQHLKMYHQIDEHIKKICCQLCGTLYTKAAPLRQHIKLFHKQWVKQNDIVNSVPNISKRLKHTWTICQLDATPIGCIIVGAK